MWANRGDRPWHRACVVSVEQPGCEECPQAVEHASVLSEGGTAFPLSACDADSPGQGAAHPSGGVAES